MERLITFLPDMSASFDYADEELQGFPIVTSESNTNDFDTFISHYHWHQDLGLMIVQYGTVEYFVNGRNVSVNAGEGLFVSSCRLHSCLSPEIGERQVLAIHISPNAFFTRTSPGLKYFARKFNFGNIDYIHLDHSEPWHKEVIEAAYELHKSMPQVLDDPLFVMGYSVRLIHLIGQHIEDIDPSVEDNNDQLLFLEMTRYVQDHYHQKMRIDDIGESVHISRSKTYHLFDHYAHMSPNTYLTNYRLTKSIELLRDSANAVAEIAAMCGFQSASYFTSVFRKEKGMTPMKYREKYRRNK